VAAIIAEHRLVRTMVMQSRGLVGGDAIFAVIRKFMVAM
jgi:hypothetical protein